MTTNGEWLFSLPLEEQIAWMESEHYEPNPDCSAMLYKMFTENMKHEPCNDYEPKRETERDGDSRELIEADAGRIVRSAAKNANTDTLWAGSTFLLLDAVIELLDRQAAITSNAMRGKIDELTVKRDELQAQVDAKDNCIENIMQTLHETQARASNLADDLLAANNERDDWKKQARAAENACYETMLEREDYRKKFGKCLDYADAIHALMDDEGVA